MSNDSGNLKSWNSLQDLQAPKQDGVSSAFLDAYITVMGVGVLVHPVNFRYLLKLMSCLFPLSHGPFLKDRMIHQHQKNCCVVTSPHLMNPQM